MHIYIYIYAIQTCISYALAVLVTISHDSTSFQQQDYSFDAIPVLRAAWRDVRSLSVCAGYLATMALVSWGLANSRRLVPGTRLIFIRVCCFTVNTEVGFTGSHHPLRPGFKSLFQGLALVGFLAEHPSNRQVGVTIGERLPVSLDVAKKTVQKMFLGKGGVPEFSAESGYIPAQWELSLPLQLGSSDVPKLFFFGLAAWLAMFGICRPAFKSLADQAVLDTSCSCYGPALALCWASVGLCWA